MPKWDDHALRYFLIKFNGETTLSGKLYQLFRQHNEHRIVYDRFVALLDYELFGKLNHRHLMVVGNLSLVGLLAVFVAMLRRSERRLADRHSGAWSVLMAVPVAGLLFNLSQWENMFWGMAALQNFSVVLWVVAAFYFLSYTRHWQLAFGAVVLASLTSGNGLMVWPLGLLLLILQPPRSRRQSPYAVRAHRSRWALPGWAVGAAVVVGLYFTGFEPPGGTHAVRPGALALLKGWLAVVGAAAEALPVGPPLRNSVLLGSLMTLATLGIIGWGILQHGSAIGRAFRQLRNSPRTPSSGRAALPPMLLFFGSSAAFVMGTAAVVAWARTGFGADLLITSRYKIYSLTLLALLYVYAVGSLTGRAGRWAVLAGGVGSLLLAWLSYYSFLGETIWWRHWLTTNQFNWTYPTNRPVAHVDSTTAHYIDPAPAFYDAHLRALFGPAQLPVVTVSVAKTPTHYAVRNETLPVFGLRDEGIYLMVRSPKRTYLFQTRQNRASLGQSELWPGRAFTNGFTAEVFPNELEAGAYRLLVLTVGSDGRLTLHPTGQTLASAGPTTAPTIKNW